MPAAKSQKSPRNLVEHLAAQAEPKPVNNILSLDRYYRSAQLLLSQAKAYREAKNEEQLYVMLLRYLSLVLETIPKHKDYDKSNAIYISLKKDVRDKFMPEMERLKLNLLTKDSPIIKSPEVVSTNRPSDVVPLSYSALPQLDWTSVDTPNADAGQPSAQFTTESRAAVPTYDVALLQYAPSDNLFDMLTSPTSAFPSTQQASSSTSATLAPKYSTSYARTASSKHSLFLPKPAAQAAAVAPNAAANAALLPRYPVFDSSYEPPNLSIPPLAQQPQQGAEHLQSLSISSSSPSAIDSLMDAPIMQRLPPPIPLHPGPQLGPQELQVQTISPYQAAMAPDTCTSCMPPPPPPPLTLPPTEQLSLTQTSQPQGGVKEYQKSAKLRDVHISLGLMEDFLHFANQNTRKGIESCGILAGVLSANDSKFTITTLIIPKQQGTTDTVQALNEEEIFMVQFEKELYPLGWIHTHPTQTCFLSSVDIHTQVGYQTMLDEAVAIVMAPSDRSRKCGIFRLTTPGGLQLIQKCPQRGFHSHPPTDTGQDIYETSAHVYLNARAKFEVIDLRNS